MQIAKVTAREILDSKGTPTLEVEVVLADGTVAIAGVPSGASTGSTEAMELRDGDPERYEGKGVLKAVANVEGPLAELVKGRDVFDQVGLDQALIEADGTDNKSHFGGNAILGVSMAACRAAAISAQTELYEHIRELYQQLSGTPVTLTVPQPMMLVLEGGKHGNWATDIQEFMIVPKREAFSSMTERMRVGTEIFQALEKKLEQLQYGTGVGFEGAFAPLELQNNEEAFRLISEAVTTAGYTLGQEIVLAIDAAASEYHANGQYVLKSEGDVSLSAEQWQQRIVSWIEQYHIWSVEDPFDETAWSDWQRLQQLIGNTNQLVGDDLLTTNVKLINRAIAEKAVNSVLIKLNQIGTVTETLQAIKVSKDVGWSTIISHRSGETSDDFIADFAVGTGAGQCKFGGLYRGERLAKYNRLMKIEELLTQQ